MTATGKEAQIAEALFTRVASLSTGSPTLPVVYGEPPATYEPPSDGKYLIVMYFPNRPAWGGMSSGRLDQGLLQITVVWPKNQGDIAPLQVAATVIAHFPLDLAMISGTTQVKVTRHPWVTQAVRETDRVSYPITIPWSA